MTFLGLNVCIQIFLFTHIDGVSRYKDKHCLYKDTYNTKRPFARIPFAVTWQHHALDKQSASTAFIYSLSIMITQFLCVAISPQICSLVGPQPRSKCLDL